jgi:AcrR family transcriptional regulator
VPQERPLRGRPPVIRDDDILDAALALFLDRGLDATTAEIAHKAGVSESIIFYRYKTKEALLSAVLERQCFTMPPSFEDLPARVGRGEIAEHLQEAGAALIAAMQTTLPLLMMAWSSPSKFGAFHKRMNTPNPVQVKLIRLLSSYFEAEARLGRLRAVDPEILARAFFGGVVDFVMSQFLHRTADTLPLAAPTFLRGLCNLLLDGARAPAHARRAKR